MAFPLTSAELWSAVVARAGSTARAEALTLETSAAHPNLDAAYLTAVGIAKSSMSKRITWPPDDMPAPYDFDVISLSLAAATAGADRRPQWIDKYEEQALKRLDDVATGKAGFVDTNDVTEGGATFDAFDPPDAEGLFTTTDDDSPLMRIRPSLAPV